MGQFLLTINGIQQLLNGVDADAYDILAQLTDVHQKNRVLLFSSVFYLEAMNKVVFVCSGRQSAGRESASVPLCIPMELIGTSVVDFFALVSIHKTQGLGPYCLPRSPAEVAFAGQHTFCVFEVVVAMRFPFP